MSTVATALSVAGTRTSGAPVRTQNGKKNNQLIELLWKRHFSVTFARGEKHFFFVRHMFLKMIFFNEINLIFIFYLCFYVVWG